MKITFVKKIKSDGSPCRKCVEVESRLEKDGYMQAINRTVIADERDKNSEGMKLAKAYQVNQAPFFIVEENAKTAEVYTVYFKLVNEVLNGSSNEADEAKDILDANNLDFL